MECCIQFEISIDGRLFYLIWVVSRSYDVKLLGVGTFEHGGRLGLLVFGLVLTDTCLSYLTDKVKIGFEEGLLTGMVLIDLQKAFDTIDHSILLEKMSCLGFAGKTIAWYTSYLTNRSFIVNVGKESSSPVSYPAGFLKARY